MDLRTALVLLTLLLLWSDCSMKSRPTPWLTVHVTIRPCFEDNWDLVFYEDVSKRTAPSYFWEMKMQICLYIHKHISAHGKLHDFSYNPATKVMIRWKCLNRNETILICWHHCTLLDITHSRHVSLPIMAIKQKCSMWSKDLTKSNTSLQRTASTLLFGVNRLYHNHG